MQLLAVCLLLGAQTEPTLADFEGYWRGTLWSQGAGQALHWDLRLDGEALRVTTEVPDWIHFPIEDQVAALEGQNLRLPVLYSNASMRLDPERGEMRGSFQSGGTTVLVHAKRAMRPLQLRVEERELKLVNGPVELAATLFVPGWQGPHPALLWLPSRGPVERWDDRRSQARWLARHGIASVIWDKRGTGQSSGVLSEARFEDLVADARACLDRLAQEPGIDPNQIGLHAESAGGWTAIRLAASEPERVQLVVTSQCPATSVRQQQADSLAALLRSGSYSESDVARALEWNDLVFDAQPTDLEWQRFEALWAEAKTRGWAEFLDETEDPTQREQLRTCWVRRHAYDPAADWPKIRVPWLAILGGKDPIVPLEQNRSALEAVGLPQLSVQVLAEFTHGQSEWPLEIRPSGASPIDSYLVWNKLPVERWQTTLDFLWQQLELSPATPFMR